MAQSRGSQRPERDDGGAPWSKKSRTAGPEEKQPGRVWPCSSCKEMCETSSHNWVNMGPPRDSTPCFWNSIGVSVYVDWARCYVGQYGFYVPLCRSCMTTIRKACLDHPQKEQDGADAIVLSMLAEQTYHKVDKIKEAVRDPWVNFQDKELSRGHVDLLHAACKNI